MAILDTVAAIPYIPNLMQSTTLNTGGLTNSSQRYCVVFQAEEAMSISKIGFRIGSVFNAIANDAWYMYSLQGVNVSGLPDGIIKGGSSPCSGQLNAKNFKSGYFQEFNLDNSYACSGGEFLSMVIQSASGAVTTVNPYFCHYPGISDVRGTPYIVTANTSAAWSKITSQVPIYGYSSGTPIYGNPIQNARLDSIPSGIKYGNQITLPSGLISKYKIGGLTVLANNSNFTQTTERFRIEVVDSGNVLLGFNEVTGIGENTFGYHLIHFSGQSIEVDAGKPYYYIFTCPDQTTQGYTLTYASGAYTNGSNGIEVCRAVNSGTSTWYKHPIDTAMVFPMISEVTLQSGTTYSDTSGFHLNGSIQYSGALLINSILNIHNFSQLNVNPYRLISSLSQFNAESTADVIGRKVLSGEVSLAADNELSSVYTRIMNAPLDIFINTELNNQPNLIINPYISIQPESNFTFSPVRLMNSAINIQAKSSITSDANRLITATKEFLNSTSVNSAPAVIMTKFVNFLNENNVSYIPSVTIDQRATLNNTAQINASSTRIVPNSAQLPARNIFSLLPSLLVNSYANITGQAAIKALGFLNVTGTVYNDSAALEAVAELVATGKLIINTESNFRNSVNLNTLPYRTIFPTIVIDANSNLSLVANRKINNNIDIKNSNIIGALSNRIINSSSNLVLEDILTSISSRICNSSILLSNNIIVNNVGQRIVSGIIICDSNSYLQIVNNTISIGNIQFNVNTDLYANLGIPSDVNIVPFELIIDSETALEVFIQNSCEFSPIIQIVY